MKGKEKSDTDGIKWQGVRESLIVGTFSPLGYSPTNAVILASHMWWKPEDVTCFALWWYDLLKITENKYLSILKRTHSKTEALDHIFFLVYK